MDKNDIDYVLNVLREATIRWEGRRECLIENRKKKKIGKYKNGNDIEVYVYQCAHCKEWFREDQIEIDHIVEVGPYKGDLLDWTNRLYDRNNLQKLCIKCHSIKTSKYNASLRYVRKTDKIL